MNIRKFEIFCDVIYVKKRKKRKKKKGRFLDLRIKGNFFDILNS